MYEWDPSLETGHEKIDSQHMQLIDALNKLIDAFKNGKEKEKTIETMEFLIAYSIKHFSMEEELMAESEYSDYLIHKRLHDEFKKVLKDLTAQLASQGPTEELIYNVISTVKNWLINHIKGDDFRMAAFVKTRKESGG